MANFENIKKLNLKYKKPSDIASYYDSKVVNESFDPNKIEKAFQDQIVGLGPNYARYFHYGLDVEAALLFVDICSFSTRYSALTSDEISEFFDEYYDTVIPIIYEYGGEIDKIMGDGIIAIFAPPFSEKEFLNLVSDANLCATRIIEETKGSKFSSKVAIHSGTIKYYQNKSGHYAEYTMIGKPLTELFRLESVSEDEKVNFFADSVAHDLHREEIEKRRMMDLVYEMVLTPYSRWNITDLKGVDFTAYYSLKI